jgi:epothilone polyketide synthase D
MADHSKLTPLQKAVAALERMQSRLAAVEEARHAPIAIVGTGCRLPGGVRTPEQFWQLLSDGVDAVTEIPRSRWDASAYYDPDPDTAGRMYTRHAAFVDGVDAFDAEFFGISPREAAELDPRQRLLLETTWEALERGGVIPRSLDGSRTAVFVGIEESDYGGAQGTRLDRFTAYTGLGRMTATAAGRLSYVLGLQGPCLALNTACSSSLVAVHLACQSLRLGECDLALAGGVSLLLSPLGFVALSRTRALSTDGRCKTFSARADGYGRGEGCGMVVLKRLSDAFADGDDVAAVIRGTAVRHDGASSGLTVPNGSSQREVIRAALEDARLTSRDVQYVECHGTGTALGDPIEVHALGAVYGEGRAAADPLLVGAVKTNIGHLEAASGVAGLLKVALALRHGVIPPSLHFDRPNPHIAWGVLPVEVVTATRQWPRHGEIARAGLSAFGMSGTNAHLIVEAAPRSLPPGPHAAPPRPEHLIVVSAKSDAALRTQASGLADHLARGADLAETAHALATTRSAFRHRIAVRSCDAETAIGLLRTAANDLAALRERHAVAPASPPAVAFMATGQGAQYTGMGRGLYATQPVFRDAIDRCASYLDGGIERPLRSVLYPEEGASSVIDETAYAQPALFALAYALAQLWRAWGVEPALLIGHSIGEYAMACVAGVFSLQDGLRLVAARGRLMQSLPQGGAMMSIAASERQAADAIAPHADVVSIAAINGLEQTVIAGDERAVLDIGAVFTARGIRTSRLRVSHAFHSPLMRPMLEPFRRVAETVTYSAPAIPLVSNVTGRIERDRLANAAYWVDHILAPVRMADGLRAIRSAGATQALEIGPAPVLCGLGAAADPAATVFWLPSLRPGRHDTEVMLDSLARLWLAGVDVDWKAFEAPWPRRRVALPTYPFKAERFWIESTAPSLPSSDAIEHEIVVSPSRQPYLADHVVHGRVVVPGAFHLAVVLALATERLGRPDVTLRNVEFSRPLPVDGPVRLRVRLTTSDGGYRFAVDSSPASSEVQWTTHAEGAVQGGPLPTSTKPDLDHAAHACTELVSVEAIYAALASMSIAWGPRWRWISEGRRGAAASLVRLSPPTSDSPFVGPLHPCVIDSAFAAGLLATVDSGAPAPAEPWLPYSVSSFTLHGVPSGPVWCGSTRRRMSAETAEFDLAFWDESGTLIAEVVGFAVKRAPERAFLAAMVGETPLHVLKWRPAPPLERSPTLAGTRWAILDDADGRCVALERALVSAGATASRATPQVVRQGSAAIVDWLDRTSGARPLDGVICWWPCDATRRSDALANERAIAGLHVLQAVQKAREQPARLIWLLTDGDPASATLWGLGRVALSEHPELHLRLVAVGDDVPVDVLCRVLGAEDDESQVAIVGADRLVLRLEVARSAGLSLAVPDGAPYRVVCDRRGNFDGLSMARSERREPRAGEVEVQVEAAGLNFRDVVNVLGMAGDLGPLGGECAGVVTAVGQGVGHLAVGHAVYGLAAAALSTYVTVEARWMVRRPAELTALEAATVPVAFLTAWIALQQAAAIRPGERVLIHAAAGGVGMAAVQLARLLGAEVYATAAPGKWEAVRRLGVAHVASSRSLSFVDEIRTATGGRGVDVVVNSLAGDLIDGGLSLLAPGGRFVELGKTDLRDPEAVAGAYPGVIYAPFDLARIAIEAPDAIQSMLAAINDHFASGALAPLPVRTWPIEDAPTALEHMARGRHVGKLALTRAGTRPRQIRPGSALVTGGLGSLGLEVARWLITSQGIRHVVLAGRRAPSEAARFELASLGTLGATVETAQCDVADRSAVQALLSSMPPEQPLRVVVHAAGVLDDGVIGEQTAERFSAVLAPKIAGAWNLHELTRSLDLDAFVLFSSSAGWLGSAGQSSYSAANTFLDALAAYRRAQGLPATAIAWGAWRTRTGDAAGMAARIDENRRSRMRAGGLGEITIPAGIAMLEAAIGRAEPALGAFPLDLARLRLASNGIAVPPLFRSLAGDPGPRAGERDLAVELDPLPASARFERMHTLVRSEVARVMGLGSVPLDQPLKERGLDSLMAIELRNGIAAKIGRPLAATVLFDYPTVDALARHILDTVLGLGGPARAAGADAARAPAWMEPIAILGMSCRFPGGADSPEALWNLLRDGADVISEVPADRWDADAWFDPDPDAVGKMYTRWGGFLPGLDRFDAAFFGISGREARSIDPQQRLMLEVSWEALERAGLTAEALADSDTGVYMGVCGTEYGARAMCDAAAIDAYAGLGTAHSAMVGRLSYAFGLRGPNLAIDTACSSSLVAVHLACQALRAGECRLALAGGANTILSPEGTVYFSRLRAMSPTGRCRSFSADADGYVRSEGAGVVVLERLSDAVAAGRDIVAIVRGTAVNQDGRSQGLTAPSGPAQQAVIGQALAQAGLTPHEIDYVECHGTGTPLGDPIEVQALGMVYGKGRSPAHPLAIGSVKSNLGHAEGAAGIAGFIKAVLSLQHREQPASLHASTLSPHIAWDTLNVEVVRRHREWPDVGRPRRAGVSAFAFSGTNAHVIVEEAPMAPAAERPLAPPAPARLALSAKSEAALRGQAERLSAYLRAGPVDLGDIGYSLRTERSAFWHRLALEATDARTASARLAEFAQMGAAPGVWSGQVEEPPPRVAFLFSGHGALYPGMAGGLYRTQPIFREAFDRCAAILSAEIAEPLGALLTTDASHPVPAGGTAQPALFSIGYALAALWREWGVTPAAVLGHGVGEYVAAHLAGVFSLEDALRLVAARGRLVQALPVAAMAGSFSFAGIGAERSDLSPDLHSPPIAQMLAKFRSIAETINYESPRTIALVSTADGRRSDTRVANADYWVEQVTAPARPDDALRALVDANVRHVIELGPAPVLTGNGAAGLSDTPVSGIPSLCEGRDDTSVFLDAVARLWVSGVPICWRDVASGPRRRVRLPTYAFQRERYWLDGRGAFPSAAVPPTWTAPGLAAAAHDTHLELQRAPLNEWLQQVVAAALAVPAVDASRPLLEQGLDSLIAVELRHRIAARLGQPLPVTLLYDYPTLDALSAYLLNDMASPSGERVQAGAGLLVNLTASPAIFFIPGALGVSMDFIYLSQRLAPEWTINALDYPGVNGGEFKRDIRSLATALADEICCFSAKAPVIVGGHSFGGSVAWEVCSDLLTRGRRVELLLMFDTFCPIGLDGFARLEQAHYRERLRRVPSAGALLEANSEMAKKWAECSRLPPDLRIVQFKVEEKDPDAMKTALVDDPRDLWVDFAAPGTYVVEQVPGIHGDFIARSPAVDELAARLRRILRATRDDVAARVVLTRYEGATA